MPTLEELIASVNAEAPEVEIVGPEVWRGLDATWQPPPSLPPLEELSLDWLRAVLWHEVLGEPDAAEIARKAEEYDREHPESQEAVYRRANPNWLREKVEGYQEYFSEYRWVRIEQLLVTATGRPEHGWQRPDRQRIAWLRENADVIRPLLEEAEAEHHRRYSPRD
jgi:hypothetical protein